MRHKWMLAAMAVAALPLTAQVRVLASNGVKAVMEELRPQLERAAGQPVTMDYATSSVQKQKIEAGEAFDIAIMTSDLIGDLIKSGKIAAGSRTEIGHAGIGVGIRKGAPKPDIRTAAAYQRTLISAKSITYAEDGASRAFLERSFERMGIAEAMKRKTVMEQGSTRSTARVASGDSELVLTLVSEILPAPGVQLVGPVPAEYQSYVSFAAGVSAKTAQSSATAAMMKLLNGPAVAPVLKRKGMEAAK